MEKEAREKQEAAKTAVTTGAGLAVGGVVGAWLGGSIGAAVGSGLGMAAAHLLKNAVEDTGTEPPPDATAQGARSEPVGWTSEHDESTPPKLPGHDPFAGWNAEDTNQNERPSVIAKSDKHTEDKSGSRDPFNSFGEV